MKRLLTLLLATMLLAAPALAAEDDSDEWHMEESVLLEDDGTETEDDTRTLTPREDFIERIIALGKSLYEKADGKAQRAHYRSDIYVCKNFTVHLFRENRDDFRIAEFPDKKLVIPNNLPAAKCKPYYYGLEWEDIPASEGNPFYAAAEFRYDSSLSKEENMEAARAFLRQAQRGDFFQMSVDYQYGIGAHSAIITGDYDPERDTIRWMDSNQRGHKVKGIRYGIVQFNEEQGIDWWAEAFCKKRRGATLYRLRDDIIYASEVTTP